MKTNLQLWWPLLAMSIIIALLSCSEEDLNDSNFEAGDTFTDSNIRLVFIDTLTVATSTMKFDSIITSRSLRMLVGKYTDPVFGTVRCESYMELLPSEYSIDAEAEYDSIVLGLGFDRYFYNDTLQSNTIHVKQLDQRLRPPSGEDFFNTSVVSYKTEDLGMLTFTPRPLGTDSLTIKLSDDLGMEFFTRLQNKTINSDDEFREYFKGITVQPDEADDGAIIGFSTSSSKSYVRLYFSTPEENERVQEYLDIDISITGSPLPFFNRVTAEEPNEYLNLLTDQEINLMSTDSENQSYIQSGIGIATRIQFPHVKKIHDIPGNGAILDAILKISPTPQTYGDELKLKDSLSVFIVDQNNILTAQLFIGQQVPVIALLNRENQEFNDIYYEVPLGSYIEKLFLAERDTGEALILLPEDYDATVDRFVLNGDDRTQYKTTLELLYAIYDEDE